MSTIKDPVNLALGDRISAYAGRRTRETHKNSLWVEVAEPDEHFRSEVSFDIKRNLPGINIVFAPDGIGTKVALIDAVRGYTRAAQDLIAMTAGDITRTGGCPVAFSNVLDVSTLGEMEGDNEPETVKAVKGLIDGLVDVANLLKFNCIKGETAELSTCVSSPNPNALLKFNWSGFMVGVNHPNKIITGASLAPGQIIIALKEFGFRSNGISKVRAIMQERFGVGWWMQQGLLEKIAVPSTLYDHFFTWLNGWQNVENNFEHYIKPHFICHLSGGSFKSKLFEDVLQKRGLSARLDDLWEPPTIVRQCAEWADMKDEELYAKWSCGQGALVVIDSRNVFEFAKHTSDFGIDAKVAGEIYAAPNPYLEITSKFSGKTIMYK